MFYIDEQGNITTVQGDTFDYNISGIITNDEMKDVVVYEYDETTMTAVAFNGSILNGTLSFKQGTFLNSGFTRDELSDVTVDNIHYYCFKKFENETETKKYCTTGGYEYKAFFRAYDGNRKTIFQVESIVINGSSAFHISNECSDLLVVRQNEETATYYFGVKLCELTQKTEDTLSIAGGDFDTLNTITVYPKKVEGV